MPAAIDIDSLNVRSRSGAIIKDVTFFVDTGEIVSIIGPSGAGKSTVLRAIIRLADCESGLLVNGRISVNGRSIYRGYSINELRRTAGLVFQKPCIFPGTIIRNVLFGVRHHRRLRRNEAKELVESVLKKAHLWNEVKDRLKRPAEELSIGQKQRLAFARTLAVNPDILLLDEPTSNLDPHSTAEIEKSLQEMKASKSVLLVTHLLEQGRRLSDRVIFLSASSGCGRIVEAGETATFFKNPNIPETRKYISAASGAHLMGNCLD